MGRAQNALELVYELRGSAMDEIADKMSTALGDAGAEKATAAIAKQMQKLLAGDVVYEAWCGRKSTASSPPTGSTAPTCRKASSSPTRPSGWTKAQSARRSARSAARRGETSGVHGLGLLGVSVNGTELVEGATTAVSGEETPEVEVQVAEPGRIDRERRSRSRSPSDGGNTLQRDDRQHRRRRNRNGRRSR